MSAAEQMTLGFCMLAGITAACVPMAAVEIVRLRRHAVALRRLQNGGAR